MNVTLDKTGNVTATVAVEILESDYALKVKDEIKRLRAKSNLKGFRPGMAPMSLIQRMYGKQVKGEVINDTVSEALTKYIHDNKINILAEPMIVKEDIDIDNGTDFTFHFNIGLAPELKVDVAALKIPYYNIEISDEMLNNQLDSLADRFGHQVAGDVVDDRALVKGSLIELDENGQPKADGLTVESTMVSPEYFRSDDQRKLFIGKKIGDKVTFNPWATCEGNAAEMASMLNVEREKADVKSDFEMEIKEILVHKKAEQNQELYDAVFGKGKIADEAAYIQAVKGMITNQLRGDSNYRFTVDTEAALRKQVGDIELPVEFLEKFLVLSNPDKYNEENVKEEVTKMIPSLEWQIIRENAAKVLGVKVEDDDLLNTAKAIAAQQFAQYGMRYLPDDMIERYAKENILANKDYHQELVARAVEEKLYAAIRATAKVAEKTISVKEFQKLFDKDAK